MKSCIATCFGLLSLLTLPSYSATNGNREEGSVSWYVAKVKAEGRTTIRLGIRRWMPVVLNLLQEALSDYMVLVASPIATAINSPDDQHIFTWYKLRISELLKAHPRPEEAQALRIPESLKPIAKNEIVVRVQGGDLTVDEYWSGRISRPHHS